MRILVFTINQCYYFLFKLLKLKKKLIEKDTYFTQPFHIPVQFGDPCHDILPNNLVENQHNMQPSNNTRCHQLVNRRLSFSNTNRPTCELFDYLF